ncbi:TPA_asm: hypothetical protein GahPV1_gp26 [Geoglobus ahangari pleomorphic virus 1]|uniref:Uncharacterized protein n=2 Tax=root TaxID=1 RepID=A0A0F7IHJ0_9EURY|nr:hypothetical protein [Geoglobus ahangari]AKG92398.1 hypothetical protein GAH_00246 [Geoglobus ahangari]
MSRVNLKANDKVEQLKRFISYRLGRKLGLGTLVFDPFGDRLIFLLDIAEKEFGKEAREELFDFLEPYHKMRVLKTLQGEAVKQRFWIAASDLAKQDGGVEEGESGDDDILSLFDDVEGLDE